jgi:hypothetical protein
VQAPLQQVEPIPQGWLEFFWSSGSVEQMPTEPGSVQVLQMLLSHAELQQTLSTQKPLGHWSFEVQGLPRPACITQAPPLQ